MPGTAEMLMMSMSTMIVPYALLSFMAPAVIYIVLRWRQYREGNAPDPQLGFKVALAFFRLLSFQVLLLGLFFFVYAAMADHREPMVRMAVGFLVPGAIVYAAHYVILARTNHVYFPMPGRLVDGLNLLMTGLTGFFSFVAAWVVTVQDNAPGEVMKPMWSLAVVYVAAWIGLVVAFARKMHHAPSQPAMEPPVAPQQPGAYPY